MTSQTPGSGLNLPQQDYGASYYRREMHRWIHLFDDLEHAVKDELERNPDAEALRAEYDAVVEKITARKNPS